MDTAAFALLRELQRRLTADYDLADIAGDLLRVGLAATGCERALACTWSPRGDPLAIATLGPPLLLPLDEEVAAFAPLMQTAAESGRFLTTEDAAKDDRFRALAHATGLKARRVGILPARGRTKAVAAIAFCGTVPAPWPGRADPVLVEIATTLSIAVETARLRTLYPVDDSTGLASSRALLARLEEEVARARRHGTGLAFAQLTLPGDPAPAAAAIRNRLRPGDLASHERSEGFRLLLAPIDRAEATEILKGIQADLPDAKIGLATMPEDATESETLILISMEIWDGNAPPPGASPPVETREARVLGSLLDRVLDRDTDLQGKLDDALRFIADATGSKRARLAIPGLADARIGEGEPESRIPLADGALLAVDLRPGSYEELLLRSLAARLGARLASSKALEVRRKEVEERRARAVETRNRAEFAEIVGSSPALIEALERVERVAANDQAVLVTGESGTGKELFARAIHALSPRKDGPFVPINCASISGTLMESEMFGHLKGSFTGAAADRKGAFDSAAGGTLFLDEVGEIPLEVQAKLLRVLQFKEIQRVGADRRIEVDVRIVAATNRDLAREVRGNRFREDLYYRLEALRIHLPPLRERREDIPELARRLCSKLARDFGRNGVSASPELIEALQRHDYPGKRPGAGEHPQEGDRRLRRKGPHARRPSFRAGRLPGAGGAEDDGRTEANDGRVEPAGRGSDGPGVLAGPPPGREGQYRGGRPAGRRGTNLAQSDGGAPWGRSGGVQAEVACTPSPCKVYTFALPCGA